MDIIDTLKNYQKQGSKFGTERARALLNALKSPDDNLKIIHVAGTNGKGTTCAYLTRIIKSSGKRVGAFTSPEVYSFAEQFCVDGAPLKEEVLSKYLTAAYREAMKAYDKPSAFDVLTAAALLAFSEEGCEYAVIECGMGGLNDSTNAINSKELAVLTSVSLEHTAYLGDTVEKICEQKAGIIKNCPAIVSAYQCEQAKKYFSSLGVKFAGERLEMLSSSALGQTFLYNGNKYFIRMHGEAQAYNAATAAEAALALGFSVKSIEEGLASTELKGRVEAINKGNVTYVLDGAHNPASFAPLTEYVRAFDGVKQLVYACLSDKDVKSIAPILCGVFDKIIVFAPDSYRAMDIESIYSAFSHCGKEIQRAGSVQDALGRARGDLIAVCGTFTVLKEAKDWIDKKQ